MDVFKMRKSTGLRQDQFWPKIGISQSGGCRYESGTRKIPKPIQMLLLIAYGNGQQRAKTLWKLHEGP